MKNVISFVWAKTYLPNWRYYGFRVSLLIDKISCVFVKVCHAYHVGCFSMPFSSNGVALCSVNYSSFHSHKHLSTECFQLKQRKKTMCLCCWGSELLLRNLRLMRWATTVKQVVQSKTYVDDAWCLMYNVDDDCLQAIVFWGSSCFAVRRSDCPVFLSGTFCLFSSLQMSNMVRMMRVRLEIKDGIKH